MLCEEEEEAILDQAIDKFKEDTDRRNEELMRFIDDFVASEEYEAYLERKRNIVKSDAYTQYCAADLAEILTTRQAIEDKYPLTTRAREMFAFMEQFERYVTRIKNLGSLLTQQLAIEAIKDKIAEVKKIYNCQKEEIAEERDIKDKQMLNKFSDAFNIDLTSLSQKTKRRIRDKIVCYRKIIHTRKLRIRHNYIEIVRKLTEEYKRQRKIDEMLNKTYTYKVKKREKIIKDMEVLGEKIILKPRYQEIEEEYIEEEEFIEELEPKDKKSQTSKGSKKDKKEKKGKKGGGKDKKSKKSSKDKKSKKEKKSKKGKKGV